MAGDMKRVAIVGGGASGLTAMKTCVEWGVSPTCFERCADIGGLWRYTDTSDKQKASVMRSTVINTSKEMMSYSDFPMPDDCPMFPHNTEVLDYFRQYAEKFDLIKHIRFNQEVLLVQRCEDYEQTGRWQVTSRDALTDQEQTEVYDGVLLCTGHHAIPHQPTWPGLDTFPGPVVHTHDYKHAAGYEDKVVLVIGIGNSGGDVAVELAGVCKQVHMSTRHGTWVLHRIADNGAPLDLMFARRPLRAIARNLPAVFNAFAKYKFNNRFDHKLYGIEPSYGPFSQHPMANDYFGNKLASGTIRVHRNIVKIEGNTVMFKGGQKLEGVDVIISATGYLIGFPYLEKGVIEVVKNQVPLYKFVFPTQLKHPTLAVIGCVQPIGALMPISEMQCRWFCRLLTSSGRVSLPSPEGMLADMQAKRQAMAKKYVSSQRHTIQVEYVEYMDELADLVGCRPEFRKLLDSHGWKLAVAVMLGPVSPYQFRLCGPHTWSGAPKAIETQWDRTYQGVNPHKLDFTGHKPGTSNTFLLVVSAAVLFLALFLFAYVL